MFEMTVMKVSDSQKEEMAEMFFLKIEKNRKKNIGG